MIRFLLVGLFITQFLHVSGQMARDTVSKINGLSLVSERFALDSSHIAPMVKLGANYAAVIPFAFMPDPKKGQLLFDLKMQWVGERVEGVRMAIRSLKKAGIHVMVKPQIWIRNGSYTGDMEMSPEEWEQFEEDYRKYLLAFAQLAEEEEVELFSIGTELKSLVSARPDYLPALIEEVRNLFSGKLTYAENWDCYDKVLFWEQLDYIGVDAYFPITEQSSIDLKTLKKGWEPIVETLRMYSEKEDRPILFTEFGYRSIEGCTVRPWDYSQSSEQVISETHQEKALQALFEVIWEEDFFVGGFLWKWFPNHERAGGPKDDRFTVQNKRAEATVSRQFNMVSKLH